MRLRKALVGSLITLVATLALTALVVLVFPPAGPRTTVEANGGHSMPEMNSDHDMHAAGAEVSGTDESTPLLASQLATARTVAARWPTAGAALADGWTLAEDYAPHVGAHYMRYAEIDDDFDVAQPEMLLFGGDTADSPIVGLAYYVVNRQPEGFIGSSDMWHQHPNVCIGPDGPLWGADGVGICATSNEWPVGNWAWMLHAWVIPEYQSPEGVFSSMNEALP